MQIPYWLYWRHFSSFIFKKSQDFIEKDKLSENNVIIEEELDDIDIDDIGNLEDSPRLVFIDEKSGNLIVVNDGGKLTRNINQKKKSDILQQPIDVHSLRNVVGESISSVAMWNIYYKSVR